MLYGRQEILELTRFSTLQRIGYVMFVSCKLSVRFVFTTPQSGLVRLSTQESQIAWVLYGQASRAISIG